MAQLSAPSNSYYPHTYIQRLRAHQHLSRGVSSWSRARFPHAPQLRTANNNQCLHGSVNFSHRFCTCKALPDHLSFPNTRNILTPSSKPTATSSSSSSSRSVSLPECVTRTVLGCAGVMMYAGVSPAGVAAFSAASSIDVSDPPSSLRVTLSPVSGDQAELLSDCLLGFGAQSVVVEEAVGDGQAEQEKFGAEAELWDSCRIIVHFPPEHDVEAAVSSARDILDLSELSYSCESVVDEQWVEQIKASYVPVQISDGLYIVPEWSEPTDPTAVNIRLTPGVAFGTGEHPTTKLCLRYLVSLGGDLSGAAVMDYGTGSGVLALGALALGASTAVGTDTDPLAVRAAQANAALNCLSDKLMVLKCGAGIDDPEPLSEFSENIVRQYDLVVSNILRGPLMELQPRLTSYCKPGGLLALSGILTEQAPDVIAQYEAFFEEFNIIHEDGWALVTARKKTAV